MRRTIRRAGVLVAAVTAAVLAFAAPASAHVSVDPGTAEQGGVAKLTFRVPDERSDATTVAVEVNLPQDTPIASVSVKPVVGWTYKVDRAKLPNPVKDDDGNEITEAVSRITWTAQAGNGIRAGEFGEFDVSVGPLPKADRVVFKTLQTYSDGAIVRWIDVPTAGGPEPEHPAPILTLTKPGGDASVATAGDSGSSGTAGVVLGILGLAAGLGALVVAVLAYRRSGSGTA